MLLEKPFVPSVRTDVSRIEIGSFVPDAASIEMRETTHVERTFTSGFGGGTVLDFKGYTITGTVTAYVKRSGPAPHTTSANFPSRFAVHLFRIWIGGYYTEGEGAIADVSVRGVTNAFTVVEFAFESHGHWQTWLNVLERS